MERAKIITICGSLRFQKELVDETERLELAGNCILSVVYPSKAKDLYTESELEILNKMHHQRIDMRDAVYIVNVDGYIGEATRSEMVYALAKGKEVLSLVPIIECQENNSAC